MKFHWTVHWSSAKHWVCFLEIPLALVVIVPADLPSPLAATRRGPSFNGNLTTEPQASCSPFPCHRDHLVRFSLMNWGSCHCSALPMDTSDGGACALGKLKAFAPLPWSGTTTISVELSSRGGSMPISSVELIFWVCSVADWSNNNPCPLGVLSGVTKHHS